jgi:hypothetical protein
MVDHRGFKPFPAPMMADGDDWGTSEAAQLIALIEEGWIYFVQFNSNWVRRPEDLVYRSAAVEWLDEHQIRFRHIQGRGNYEFAFRDEQEATLFKLAFG